MNEHTAGSFFLERTRYTDNGERAARGASPRAGGMFTVAVPTPTLYPLPAPYTHTVIMVHAAYSRIVSYTLRLYSKIFE